MPRDWETQLRAWAEPPTEAETEKMKNAESQIRDAIAKSPKLGERVIEVFAQGSYSNRTNVPRESDVDVAVVCKDTFGLEWQTTAGTPINDSALIAEMRTQLDIVDATYPYSEFKQDVEDALVTKFGRAAVERGDKAFDVHETRTRVDSDVLAAFAHRRYSRDPADGRVTLQEGTKFYPDSGGQLENFPEQQYDNGVAMNDATGQRFKAMVRALKNLRNEMDDYGFDAAGPIPSFLIECLAYNVPNSKFNNPGYVTDMKAVIAHAWEATRTDGGCTDWVEESGLKWLFRSWQGWTRDQANAFLYAAWNFDELGDG
jgi:hypothetical protein